jgi:hypothetical protein
MFVNIMLIFKETIQTHLEQTDIMDMQIHRKFSFLRLFFIIIIVTAHLQSTLLFVEH